MFSTLRNNLNKVLQNLMLLRNNSVLMDNSRDPSLKHIRLLLLYLRLGPRESPLSTAIPLPDVPVGGRLSLFLKEWRSITNDTWTLSIIEEGYSLQFKSIPPLSNTPLHFHYQHPALSEVVESLLEKNAVERVTNPKSPGFYSRLFLVPKKNGSWRPVIDLSTLNKFIIPEKFKMETSRSIRNAIQMNDWAVSLDLTDAYYHIMINPYSRKYQRFIANGEVLQFRVLPFGIASAPRIFTKIMGKVGAYLRMQGPQLLQYFDDWLLHKENRANLLEDLYLT